MRPGLWSSDCFRWNVSGSSLLQSSVCKVNSAGDNAEPSGLFRSDGSDSDTVCRVSIESDPLLGKAEFRMRVRAKQLVAHEMALHRNLRALEESTNATPAPALCE